MSVSFLMFYCYCYVIVYHKFNVCVVRVKCICEKQSRTSLSSVLFFGLLNFCRLKKEYNAFGQFFIRVIHLLRSIIHYFGLLK